jgi:hypothetical protein
MAGKTSEARKIFLQLMAENSVEGVIENPVSFWKEAGFLTRNAAHCALWEWKKRGVVRQLTHHRYQVGAAIVEDIPTIAAPVADERLILTPLEKAVFDTLNDCQPKVDDRILEADVQFGALTDEDERNIFIMKMHQVGIFEIKGRGTKGRIIRFDSERYLALVNKAVILGSAKLLLDGYAVKLRSAEQAR